MKTTVTPSKPLKGSLGQSKTKLKKINNFIDIVQAHCAVVSAVSGYIRELLR